MIITQLLYEVLCAVQSDLTRRITTRRYCNSHIYHSSEMCQVCLSYNDNKLVLACQMNAIFPGQ